MRKNVLTYLTTDEHLLYFREDQIKEITQITYNFRQKHEGHFTEVLGRWFNEPVFFLRITCYDYIWDDLCRMLGVIGFYDTCDISKILDRTDNRYYTVIL